MAENAMVTELEGSAIRSRPRSWQSATSKISAFPTTTHHAGQASGTRKSNVVSARREGRPRRKLTCRNSDSVDC